MVARSRLKWESASMTPRWFQRARVVLAVSSSFLLLAACWGQTQTAPSPAQAKNKAHSKGKVDPGINAQFQKANVKDFIKRFESNDREVFVKRREITKALELKPGMAVADIGAGTGLFTRLFANEVGPSGKVYAVDISKDFLDYITAQARSRGQTQIVTIRGTQDSTNLPQGSVDLVFLCDVYHHLENHEKILASIHLALRPGGMLVLVEFDRVEGKSSEFVLKHIRASQNEFRGEVESAGFETVQSFEGPKLRENFIAKFRKVNNKMGTKVKARAEKTGGHS
jgi:ubiquinone/menaquinone biosynthesis C-methylase UbiE